MFLKNYRSLICIFGLISVVIAVILSSCGRKGDPEPSTDTGYPHQYPAQNPECDVN